jgi:hypothetical protein
VGSTQSQSHASPTDRISQAAESTLGPFAARNNLRNDDGTALLTQLSGLDTGRVDGKAGGESLVADTADSRLF